MVDLYLEMKTVDKLLGQINQLSLADATRDRCAKSTFFAPQECGFHHSTRQSAQCAKLGGKYSNRVLNSVTNSDFFVLQSDNLALQIGTF